MNEFTKEELQIIHLDMTAYISSTPMLSESPSHRVLRDKVEFLIDNYKDDPWNSKRIAQSHLSEAENLIGHAMILLGMRKDDDE